MRKFSWVLAGAAGAGLMLAAAGGANAGVFNFNYSSGCPEACMGNATITTGSGMLTVVLRDTQANPASAGDLISNLEITPSGSLGPHRFSLNPVV